MSLTANKSGPNETLLQQKPKGLYYWPTDTTRNILISAKMPDQMELYAFPLKCWINGIVRLSARMPDQWGYTHFC